MNQFCLVGQIATLPELKTSPAGWKTCTVTLQVERPFANTKGEFETDMLTLEVWRGAAETLAACARLDSWIAARGRVQSRRYERDGKLLSSYQLVAEKIEYLR